MKIVVIGGTGLIGSKLVTKPGSVSPSLVRNREAQPRCGGSPHYPERS